MATLKTPHSQHAVSQRVQDRVAENQVSTNSQGQAAEKPNLQAILTYGANNRRLLRRPEVEALTGLSRSTIYDWMKHGKFPPPVKLGERLVAWRESDVTAWLESRETRVA